MEKIGLLIDSTTLTREDLKQYGFVKVAQLKVQVDEETFNESQLSKEEMLRYIDEGKKFLTSQPSPAEFLDAYKAFFEEGYTHVIAIVLSHKISGTYQSAMIAKSMIDFKLEVDVHSPNSASFGISIGAKKLADAIASGTDYKAVNKYYYKLFDKPLVTFTLGSLSHLFRGGRLNRVQALIGRILRIKPIIEMLDGKLELVKKERTNVACMDYFLAKIDAYSKEYQKVYLDIININMPEWGTKLLEAVKEKYPKLEIHETDYLTPVFYSHLGDKGFGIAILAE